MLKGIGVESLTADDLEIFGVEIEERIGDLRSTQAALLSEVEARQIPLADGCRSLNEWAAARLDVSPETASDLVRLTHTDHDPGRGSVDRRVVTVKLAEAGASESELERSFGFDISGVRRLASQRKRLTPTDEREAYRSRYLCIQPSLDESQWRVHGRLPGADGRIVEEVLTARADSFPHYGIRDGAATRKADALVSLCQDQTPPNTDGGSGPLLTVFVDTAHAAATNGEAGVTVEAGPRVGVQTIEEILCGGTVEVIARQADGTPMKYGRQTRVVPPSLRRAILSRDGHACTVEGCSSRYRLQIHHTIPYSEGGTTDPDNLATICWYHHHVSIHGRGMRIDPQSPFQRRHLLPPNRLPRPPPG